MRVLLVGPDHEDNLSIRYLASPLQRAGHTADLVGFNGTEHIPRVVAAVADHDVIGLSMVAQCMTPASLQLAAALRSHSRAFMVAGGHHASCAADAVLARAPQLDCIIVHEGEHALVELVERLAGRRPWSDLPGLVLRLPDGRVHRTPPRPILRDLDVLAFPDRRGPAQLHAGVPTAYLLGSRGCVSACDYCCIMTLHRMAPGPRFRQRNPNAIADEMAGLYHGRGIRQFIFHDDNFLVPSVSANHRRIEALARAWEARGLHGLGLVIKCRPPDVEQSVFTRLRQLGLLRVFLGVESASSEGLRAIGRHQAVAQSEHALSVCRDLGISAQFTLMCFHPDATPDTVQADVDFMRRHADFALNFCRAEIYAGTPLEQRMLDEGRARGDEMARAYTIADPVVERAASLALRIFRPRCCAVNGLMPRAIGLDHLAAVVRRFYDDAEARDLDRRVRAWTLALNRELADQLQALLDGCMASDEAGLDALVAREAQTRRDAVAHGESIRQGLERFAMERVGLVGEPVTLAGGPVRALRPAGRPPARPLARHAAAVLVAVAAAGAPACMCGVSETAAVPLDSDGDGLPDACERTVFHTDPNHADTDGDGVPDGKEPRGNTGLTNQQAQDQAGAEECPAPLPDGGVDGGNTNGG